MYHEHHKQIINKLKQHFMNDPNILALIINGSVARGSAGPESDVDFVLVVTDLEYEHRESNNEIHFNCNEFCITACTEVNGSTKTERMLKWLAKNGTDVARYAFIEANIIFSKLPDLNKLLEQITTFSTHDSKDKLESFYSQVKMHYSYLEYGYYSQNTYVLNQTAVLLALFGGRMILTHNNMFYPGRKWFMTQLEEAEQKPKDFIYSMKELLQFPNLSNAKEFCDILLNFRDWPKPHEGWFNRFEKDMKQHRWNTID